MPGPEQTFSVVRELARREVERHRDVLIGITTTAPMFKDVNGVLEFVVNVRVGTDSEFEVVKDVLVAQEAVGIITDVNVPVRVEKSEAGQLTVIGRSEIALSDISLNTYSYGELGFTFMTLLEEDTDGTWRDGFGFAVNDPNTQFGESIDKSFSIEFVEWGGNLFEYGVTTLGETTVTITKGTAADVTDFLRL